MTFIGKLLAVLNLIIGVGVVTWSVTAYAQRPGWFDPPPEGVDKGHSPENFAMLKAETEALARTANVASGTWGAAREELKKLEELRDVRRKAFAERLEWAHKGNPKNAKKAAFFTTVMEKDPKTGKTLATVDVTKLGAPVVGPDDQPLQGVEGLLANVTNDTKEIERLALQIAKHREDYKALSKDIREDDERLVKMIVIRDAVLAERFYLDSFEVNVYETRETVLRRQRQLRLRLAELGLPNP